MELGDDPDLTTAAAFRPRARGQVAAAAVGIIIGALGALGATLILALSDGIVIIPKNGTIPHGTVI